MNINKASSAIQFISRPSNQRGRADHGWLKTFHTFSFAGYSDPDYMHFGCLRVVNEDRVAPHEGFDKHGHREFEIFSYVVSGELQHNDSMGNSEVLKRGDIQMTSAGTGIRHSEHTHGESEVHFLQMWSLPSESNLQPKYFTRHFSDDEKKDKWACVVASVDGGNAATSTAVSLEREASGPAPVHSPLSLYATLLSPGRTVAHTAERTKAYVHVVQTSGYNIGAAQGATVRVSAAGESIGAGGARSSASASTVLREGDAVYVHLMPGAEIRVENTGDRVAEVLMFDLE